jgi:predicted lipid-binding transport protein (Tim44 family)
MLNHQKLNSVMQIFSFVLIIAILGILQSEAFVFLRFNDQRENIIKYAQHQPHSASRTQTNKKNKKKTTRSPDICDHIK